MTIMEARVALWAFLVSITSSIAAAQQISVAYNHSQIFSRFQTYSWRADEIKRVGQTMLSQLVRQDVDTAMQNKGLQQVHEDQTPDLIVMASSNENQQTSSGAWGTFGVSDAVGRMTPHRIRRAILILDLYKARTPSLLRRGIAHDEDVAQEPTLVWRGIAQDTLSGNINRNQLCIKKAVQKMFKQYPVYP
jgi:hypothetical protein